MFDVIDPPDDIMEHIASLDLIQFGGKRNNAYGVAELVDHVEIDLNSIEIPATASHITLLSPILYIPRFVHSYNCRKNIEVFWNNGKQNRLEVIPQGQFFRIKSGKEIKNIALKGILRKYLFGKFGDGEYYIKDWNNNQEDN